MDYGEIINSAFRLSWRKKSLWIFGLFAFGMAYPSLDWEEHFDFSKFDSFGFDQLNLDGNLAALFTLVGLLVALMVIIHVLLNAISTPALVDAVNRITRGGQYRFKTSLQTGIQYMWRTLALMIL
ncbi:MAG: hypothetical protein KKA81_16465, partial [Bacteroidetes bacterium]|nr:hypothetical protein [Bacteroidota bacterium]